MIDFRPHHQRGRSHYGGWLESYHSFSFAEYIDPANVHWSVLRVLNDDRVAAGTGFPPHPHRDMEIISYVVDGGLAHQDSLGNGSVIRAGEVQRMTAGTGIVHSEYAAGDEPVHFLQIWILAEKRGLTPGYEQRSLGREEKLNRWRLVADQQGSNGALLIHQQLSVYATVLEAGQSLRHAPAGSHVYLHVVRGEAALNGKPMTTGDGAKIRDERELLLKANKETEALLFDMP